jgi:hypothetical protein
MTTCTNIIEMIVARIYQLLEATLIISTMFILLFTVLFTSTTILSLIHLALCGTCPRIKCMYRSPPGQLRGDGKTAQDLEGDEIGNKC